MQAKDLRAAAWILGVTIFGACVGYQGMLYMIRHDYFAMKGFMRFGMEDQQRLIIATLGGALLGLFVGRGGVGIIGRALRPLQWSMGNLFIVTTGIAVAAYLAHSFHEIPTPFGKW